MKKESVINIILTENFKKEAKVLSRKYNSFEDDIQIVLNDLRLNPFSGDSLGKNCFKIRFKIKSKNKGKSGGGRLIMLVKIVNMNIYLLSIYDKSEKDTISDSELTELMKELF